MKTQIAVSLIVITMILSSLMTAPAQAQEEGAHGGAPGAITGGPIFCIRAFMAHPSIRQKEHKPFYLSRSKISPKKRLCFFQRANNS